MNRLAIIFMCAAISVPAAQQKKLSSNVGEMFGSQENVDIVSHPEAVDACLLRYIPPPKGKSDDAERYEETEFVGVSIDSAAVIEKALLDDSTYRWNAVTVCWPRYQTRVRFHKGGHIVAVDFCFGCKVLQVLRDGSYVDGGLFYHQWRPFLEEMKRLFPSDSGLEKVRLK